jgi:hypothetical protein
MAETTNTLDRFRPFKEEINDLYVVQGKKLKEVMPIMAQRGLDVE